jgi:DNA-binding transcriptional regulator YhcF (GntR family)
VIHRYVSRSLQVDPAAAAPLWSQIEEGVRRLVASGALAAGAVVPSVRDLARELSVNPATVAKAYQRLVDAGVLAVRRGEGTFVAEAPPTLGRDGTAEELSTAATRYASVAVTLGATRNETLDAVKGALASLKGGRS